MKKFISAITGALMMFALSVPMAVLLSTLMTFGRLSEDNEINAMRASGISFITIIRAPLLFGIGGAGIIFAKNAIDNKNYRKKREKQMADIIAKEAVYEAEALKKKQERERQKELYLASTSS